MIIIVSTLNGRRKHKLSKNCGEEITAIFSVIFHKLSAIFPGL